MKITCPYCGNLFNDTLEKCPSCGAPNAGVVRRSGDQPLTIEQLQKWYAERGLPPYETTRFFIGIDYKKPRAFGIYKDKKSGNYVVYKNKDNGSRAVRYEGTDEAYAVNELYQRLKEEIIQQKKVQGRGGTSGSSGSGSGTGGQRSSGKRRRRSLLSWMGHHPVLTVLLLILLGFAGLIAGLMVADPPRTGYYSYEDTLYYAEDSTGSGGESINTMYWYAYDEDTGEWSDSLSASDLPDILEKDETAIPWFISEDWSEDMGGSAHPNQGIRSLLEEEETEETVESGYYDYNGTVYYHIDEDPYYGWYYYDARLLDWDEADVDELPQELYVDDTARDFYYTPTWDASTQITDFTDSSAYEEYIESAEERSQADNHTGWDNANDDNDYNWGGGDTWDWGGTTWDSDW